MHSLSRALHGTGVFARAQRDTLAFAAEFEALEEIAHALPEAVVTEGVQLDLIHEPAAELRGFVAHAGGDHRDGVLLALEIRIQQLDDLNGGRGRRGAAMAIAMQEGDKAASNPARVRQVEGNVEMGSRLHAGNLRRGVVLANPENGAGFESPDF